MAEPGGPDFPVAPGGGSAATSGSDQVDNNGMLRGRVCVIDNLLDIVCASNGADNIVVRLGDQMATTSSSGSFSIPATPGTGLSFTVSGPEIVTTTQALTARAQINAIRQSTFDNMLLTNNLVTVPNTGSVIASVTRAGVPVTGVTASSTPAAPVGPFFAGTEPEPWTTNSTGASGIVWFPGLNIGPASLTFNTLTGGEAIVGGIQVVNGGITMVETPLP